MNIAVGRTRDGRQIRLIFTDCVSFIFAFPYSHSSLISIITSSSQWNFIFESVKKKGKGLSPEGEAKVNSLICSYSSILPISPPRQPLPAPLSDWSHRLFFFPPSPKFISALMDILSTDGFWFRLLMLSASPNIHFGCSAPSHWFLWRWNSDWTDLSWRPRAQACASHRSSIWKRSADDYLTGKRRRGQHASCCSASI